MQGRSSRANEWSTEAGRVVFEKPAPTVLVFRMSGRMDPEFVDHFEKAAAPFVQEGRKVDFFFDTHEMTGYHPAFRDRMTKWHEALKPNTRSANVLVTSKIVGMAIAVANLVTGGLLKTYSDPRAFEAAIAGAIRAAPKP